ncbi:MAG: sulfite exporter TauE/SafE family protein [Gammaproteobacteria bacterium]
MAETDLFILFAYLLLGSVAGIIGGLLGLGGGIIIVPALLYVFIRQGLSADILMHMAVATSLATIIFTSISSTYAHHRHGAVLWRQVRLLMPGIILGGCLGAFIAGHLPSDTLRTVFGIFELLVAIQIGLSIKPSAQRELPGGGGMIIAGGGIGSLSTILGIGGGTITVPFLLWCNINIRNAVATSAACGLPIAIAGTIAMIIAGWDHPLLPEGTIGYVYWPAAITILFASVLFAPLGARLAHSIPIDKLKSVFAVVLACVGIRMLF